MDLFVHSSGPFFVWGGGGFLQNPENPPGYGLVTLLTCLCSGILECGWSAVSEKCPPLIVLLYNYYTTSSDIIYSEPVLMATCIQRPPILRGHSVMSQRNLHILTCIQRPPLYKGHYEVALAWPLNTGFTVVWLFLFQVTMASHRKNVRTMDVAGVRNM